MTDIHNFSMAFDPLTNNVVLYANGMADFSSGGYLIKGLNFRGQNGDAEVDSIILNNPGAFESMAKALASLARSNTVELLKFGGQLWWNQQDLVSIGHPSKGGPKIHLTETSFELVLN
ncbi:hypothetical protein [Neptuniibacter sp. QD37_11]|uniref:hypothetical protein n=1 Tax=Neptuniibacter sp. QD37_11 TaxID=3398209 RepID=UPI0039F451D8